MKRASGAIAWSAIDFLSCVLLIVFVMIAPPVTKHAQIETLGLYAVVVEWPAGLKDDVDLYLQAPDGGIVFYLQRDSGLLHLEHDDLGEPDKQNRERAVLRGELPGEYIVNVHLYSRAAGSNKPIPVKVYLWRLRGADKVIHTRTVTLERKGQEVTAFRFTTKGKYSTLSKQFVIVP